MRVQFLPSAQMTEFTKTDQALIAAFDRGGGVLRTEILDELGIEFPRDGNMLATRICRLREKINNEIKCRPKNKHLPPIYYLEDKTNK